MLKPLNRAEVQFDFLKEIGADGRNSRTFLANDHQLDAQIVIKQIEKSKLASASNFFDESKALYASAHPNVVQVHYACQDADHVFVAMPFYPNGSVKGLITGRHMTVREIVTIGCQVLSGLHNIHSKGLIHFDVKPDNILLSKRNEGLISDFGQAKQMNFSGVAAQDRHYMKMYAPEALTTDQFKLTFDIYQFGLTLYRMCNGNEAFYEQFDKYGPPASFDRDAFRYDLRNGKFPDRKCFPPHIPSRLRTIVRKCLQTDPSNRYQTALDVANDLAAVDGATLDWRLSESTAKRMWTKNEHGTKCELSVLTDGSSECFKTVGAGTPRRVKEACQGSFPDKDIAKFLGSY